MAKSHVRRRGLLASAGQLAAGGATAGPLPPPSPILAAGLQLKHCWKRYDGALFRENRADEEKVWAEIKHLEATILNAAPRTLAECAVVLMVALAEIDAANVSQDGEERVAAGVRKAGRAMLRVFDIGEIEPLAVGGESYIAACVREGEAEDG